VGKSVVFEDQSARDLRLSIVQGDLDKSQLSILATKQLVGPTPKSPLYRFEANIIGASHLLVFQLGELTVSEVLACCNVDTENQRAHCGPLDHVLGSVELDFPGQIKYRFEVELEDWKSGFARLQSLVPMAKEPEERAIGMIYDFPQEGLFHPPQTIVSAKAVRGGVGILTAHSYPNEESIVFSQTHISLL